MNTIWPQIISIFSKSSLLNFLANFVQYRLLFQPLLNFCNKSLSLVGLSVWMLLKGNLFGLDQQLPFILSLISPGNLFGVNYRLSRVRFADMATELLRNSKSLLTEVALYWKLNDLSLRLLLNIRGLLGGQVRGVNLARRRGRGFSRKLLLRNDLAICDFSNDFFLHTLSVVLEFTQELRTLLLVRVRGYHDRRLSFSCEIFDGVHWLNVSLII